MAPLPLLRQVVICWRILCSQIWHKLCAQGRIRRASVGNLRVPFTLVTCGTCGTCATWVLLMRPALTRFWPPCHKPDSIGSGSNMLFSVKQRGGPEQWAKHMHTCWNSEYCHCLPFHRLLHRMASDEIHQCIDHWLCRPRGRECPLHVSDQEATEPANHARYAAKASSI